jgi:hypothetical protein
VRFAGDDRGEDRDDMYAERIVPLAVSLPSLEGYGSGRPRETHPTDPAPLFDDQVGRFANRERGKLTGM